MRWSRQTSIRWGLWASLIVSVVGVGAASEVNASDSSQSRGGAPVLLDTGVEAGGLIFFRSIEDKKLFYYAPVQARLATEAGVKKFSFVRYTSEEGAFEGGLVHALVTLGVTKAARRRAVQALRRRHPGARVGGALVFSQGTFRLVASFAEENGKTKSRVVGVGTAPLIGGTSAAVSIALGAQEANLLWETFKTTTPDISFKFEMGLDGYLSPVKVKVEANLDRIHRFMKQEASIALVRRPQPATASGHEDRTGTGAAPKDPQDERSTGDDEGALAEDGLWLDTSNAGDDGAGSGQEAPSVGNEAGDDVDDTGGRDIDESSSGDVESKDEAADETSDNDDLKGRDVEKARAGDIDNAWGVDTAGESYDGPAEPRRAASGLSFFSGAEIQRAFEKLRTEGAIKITQVGSSRAIDEIRVSAYEQISKLVFEPAGADRLAEIGRSMADDSALRLRSDAALDSGATAFSAYARYTLRKSRRTGMHTVNMNQYLPVRRQVRFDQNIGDLRRHLGQPQYFREASLRHRVRRIAMFVDGLNEDDFGRFVNYVSVQLRKRHASGGTTERAITIDRAAFNKSGNRFELTYRWREAGDRTAFEYEIRPEWSVFGGCRVAQFRAPSDRAGWRPQTSPAVTLVPPVRRRRIEIHADPEKLKKSGVRAVSVKLFYDLGLPGCAPRTDQIKLDLQAKAYAKAHDVLLPRHSLQYAYEVTWRLADNKKLTSGRRSSTEPVIFVDRPQ